MARTGLLLSVAAVAGILPLTLAWSFIEIRDGRWSIVISNAALPWMLLLGLMAVGALVFTAVTLRAPPETPTSDLGDRLLDVLRSGELDVAKTQRVAVDVINALPNPIFFKGDDGSRLDADEVWHRLFGVSRTVFVCNMVRELHAGKMGAAGMSPRTATHLHQQVFTTTINTGGDSVDTVHRKAASAPADVSTAGLIGTIINIVERKEAELFDMLGFTREELVGKTLLGADSRKVGKNATPQHMTKGAMISLSTEMPIVRENGKCGWDRRTLSIVGDKTGKPEYLYCAVTDITVRKLGEQRQAMERSINRLLAETVTVSEALPMLIEAICHNMLWRCGT